MRKKQNDRAILYTIRWLQDRGNTSAEAVADALRDSMRQHGGCTQDAGIAAAVKTAARPWMQTDEVLSAMGEPVDRPGRVRVAGTLRSMGWTDQVIRPDDGPPKRCWRPKGLTMADYRASRASLEIMRVGAP